MASERSARRRAASSVRGDGRVTELTRVGHGGAESPALSRAFLADSLTTRARQLAVLVLLPALLFIATVRFDFVLDDNLVILEDPLVTGGPRLGETFGSEVRVGQKRLGYYRPLITLSYQVDRALWGTNPAGYHLSNLAWHILATLLVWAVGRRTLGPGPGAFVAAILFAVLPAHTEAVAWIQGRVDLISAALALGAFLALFSSRAASGAAAWAWAGLAAFAYLAGLLAKESVAPLPLVWMLWEGSGPTGKPARFRGLMVRLSLLLLALAIYWALRGLAVGSLGGSTWSIRPVGLRGLALLDVLAEYGRMLILPRPGLNLHTFHAVAVRPASLLVALLTAGAIGGGLLVAWRRSRRLFSWMAWMLLMLAPPLLFILDSAAPSVGFLTSERYLYLPSVGYCAVLGWWLGRSLSGTAGRFPRWAGGSLLAVVVLGYAGLPLANLRPWSDPAELYRRYQARPGNPLMVQVMIHTNLGKIYVEREQLEAARAEFEAALRLRPDYAIAMNNLGAVLLRSERPGEALRWLKQAIDIDPTYADAYVNLGGAHEALGDPAAARRAYEAGLQLVPTSPRLASRLDRLTGAARLASPSISGAPR